MRMRQAIQMEETIEITPERLCLWSKIGMKRSRPSTYKDIRTLHRTYLKHNIIYPTCSSTTAYLNKFNNENSDLLYMN